MLLFSSDIDILCHWLGPAAPTRVSSFGSLKHFRKSAKPAAAGSAMRCLACPMEKDCAYSAKKSKTVSADRFSRHRNIMLNAYYQFTLILYLVVTLVGRLRLL